MPRFFHVTSSLNRDSIARYGLDWRRMGATHGVAGVQGVPARPEAEGIFISRDDWTEVERFAEMAIDAGHGCVDVWDVQLPSDATFVAYDGSPGYEYYPESIPPQAMSLIQADWSPKSRFRD